MNNTKDIAREKVIPAASRMFITQGCKNVTMDDVAKKLRMSKRTLYEMFGDKEALLNECMEYIIQSDKVLAQQLYKAKDFDDFFVLIHNIKQQRNIIFDIHQHFSNELRKYYPNVFRKQMIMHSKERLEGVKQTLANFKEQKIIRDDVDIDVAAVFLNEVSQQIIFDHFSIPNYKSSELLSNFLVTYFRGIATRDFTKEWDKRKNTKTKE